MHNATLTNMALGFVAAAIAVVTAHQLMYVLISAAGLANLQPWSMRGIPPFGVPAILNGIFWGGLWGALFALIHDRIPGTAMWLKGLIYGLCILVVSNWFLLPLIKGQIFGQPNQVLFAGGDPRRMLIGILILGAFGAALGWLYGMLTTRMARA